MAAARNCVLKMGELQAQAKSVVPQPEAVIAEIAPKDYDTSVLRIAWNEITYSTCWKSC